MSEPTFSRVPLLGALCVMAGLVSHEQVEQCIELQHISYPGTPIGQILVLRGYLTQIELARIVAQQQNFRRVFCVTLESCLVQADAEPNAPTAEDTTVQSVLPELGTFAAEELDTSPLFGASR